VGVKETTRETQKTPEGEKNEKQRRGGKGKMMAKKEKVGTGHRKWYLLTTLFFHAAYV